MELSEFENKPQEAPEEKIDREFAEREFLRFAKRARLRMNCYRTKEQEEKFKSCSERFIEEVMNGVITVNEEGWPTIRFEFAPWLPSVTLKKRPIRQDVSSIDRAIDKPAYASSIYVAAAFGIGAPNVEKLDKVDYDILEAITDLF